ncbi:hypothetical protein SRB5_53250 [Streptomyces sp. RB5]|uniref:Uncharacterized protein n=1 Tax=Streptomyces smaragdinus TaxID=2585196 RepID=A0A7K0CNT2_9ACTN|nr:hypothetical protein [Streptomyces smaragdinus]
MIRGLSTSAKRQIAVFEREHGLPAGEVAHAFRRWNANAKRPYEDVDRFYERDDTDLRINDYHVRTLLEITIHALRRRARRELSAAIGPADGRFLDRSLNNPFAPRDLPWWLRRIGV